MTQTSSLVAISGNVRVPSRTEALVRLIQADVEERLNTVGYFVSSVDAAPHVMGALTREALRPDATELIGRIEAADVLILGSPIYRASYTGALKHLFDLVHNQSLIGTVAIIAATGGTPLHGLAVEHQFRPLLSYFGVVAAQTAIYALETDFDGFELVSSSVRDRIARAADEVALLARSGLRRSRLAAAAA